MSTEALILLKKFKAEETLLPTVWVNAFEPVGGPIYQSVIYSFYLWDLLPDKKLEIILYIVVPDDMQLRTDELVLSFVIFKHYI